MAEWGEPAPTPTMHDLVITDMASRKQFGLAKYGTPLQAGNGRDPLKDAYEEALDLTVYLRQELEERQAERDRIAQSPRENEFGPGAGAVDSGATIRGVVKTLADYGTTGEAIWPYRDGAAWNVRPPEPAYTTAQARQVLGYRRVPQSDVQIAAAVAARLPVVFGALIYEQMMDDICARTGVVNTPSPTARPVGGHAMLIVGYDFASRVFEVRNSWGRGWGRSGYCTFPMEYLTNPQLASDFWVIAQVES